MFKASQLRDLIIKPTLIDLVMFSKDTLDLLMFTCAVESDGGTYLRQIKGSALGIYGMETDTYNDIWQNYIKNRGGLISILSSNFNIYQMPEEERLIYDLRFATIMACLHYEKVTGGFYKINTDDNLWHFYKNFYNCHLDIAEKDVAIKRYHDFISG